ncbi:MAG: hypothetical protein Q9181_005311 [Wetmoreana brouardii]
MSRYSGLLERNRLQTFSLPPERWMHILDAGSQANSPTQVLYKKSGGASGYLGSGSFGAVHLEIIDSECEAAPTIRAVKTIRKRAAKASKIRWEQEVENLIVLSQFPDLFVKIFGWWEDEESIFLPMEYFEASDLSRNKDFIRDEGDIRAISQQIANGLQQMHSLNIIHRDIKPQKLQNVFVARQQPTWHVKIGDFGFSKRVSDSVSAPFSARGTTKYMAPEYRDLLNDCESSDFTTAVDMWSFGCLIYELFARRCPFEEADTHSLMKYVRDGVFPRQPLDDCGASSESIWLITNLLEREPDRRLSAHDALRCAWLETTTSGSPRDSVQNQMVLRKAESDPLPNSTSTPFSTAISDSVPSSPNPGTDSTVSFPPKVVVVPAETQKGARNNVLSDIDPLSRSSLTDSAIYLPDIPHSQVSVDDAALPIWKTFEVPDLPPRPNSSNTTPSDTDIFQGVQNLALNTLSSQQVDTSTPKIMTKATVVNTGPTRITRKPLATGSTIQSLPYLRSTQLSGSYVDMAFKNLKFKPQRKPTCDVCESRRVFNPVIKPAALYQCKDCNNRPLCARCIVEIIRGANDPHEADHKLQAWIQAHSFPVREFVDRFQPHAESAGGLDPNYGRSWSSSDLSFTPPAEGSHGTRWILNAPAGDFEMSIQVRISHFPEAIEGTAIGVHKAMMVRTRAVPLGSLMFGARLIDAKSSQVDEAKSSRHLPDRPNDLSIKLAREDQTITLKLGFKLNTTTDQKIEVHVRGSYDALYFRAGSPFKWRLDQILLTEMGDEQHVASMGDLQMREKSKERQAKMRRHQNLEKGMGYLGQGLGIAGKINGVRSASSSKQSNLLFSAVSAGLNLGGSMMRDTRMSQQDAAASPAQQPAVYNNYYFSNDSFANTQPNAQSYAESEYEQAEEEDYVGQPNEQQYLDNNMDDHQAFYGEEDSNEWQWQQQQQRQ